MSLTCPPVSDLEPVVYWIRPTNNSVKDSEVGPSDSPVPFGDIVEVPLVFLDLGGGYNNVVVGKKNVWITNF